MGEKGISRRSFLKWSAGALASVALLEFERPARAFAAEAGGAATLSEIPASVEQIARESPLIKENMAKLDAYAASLKESGLRTKVQGVLENLSTAACPRPSSSRRHARTTIRAARKTRRTSSAGCRRRASLRARMPSRSVCSRRRGKLVAPIGAEGFLVHLGDHDWVLSGFAAARCVAYLRDYAKRSFGTLPEARFNALRNYVGSRVSYMRLYQAIAQGGADALMASVVKAQACLRRAAGKMREAWRERAPTPAAVGFAFHRRRMVDLVAPAGKIKARQASARMIW